MFTIINDPAAGNNTDKSMDSSESSEKTERREAIERLTLKLPGVVPKEPEADEKNSGSGTETSAPSGTSPTDDVLPNPESAIPSTAENSQSAAGDQSASLTSERQNNTEQNSGASKTGFNADSDSRTADSTGNSSDPDEIQSRYLDSMEGFEGSSISKSKTRKSAVISEVMNKVTASSMALSWHRTIWGVFLLCVLSVLFKFENNPGILNSPFYSFFGYLILAILCMDALRRIISSNGAADYIRSTFFDPPIILTVLYMHWDPDLVKALFIIRQVFTLFTSDTGNNEDSLLSTMVQKFKLNPAQVITSTFLGVIFIGTVLLMLPYASSKSTCIGFVNALFTSTSATCVTGLVTLDTGTDFSLFGQLVIMALFQIGGLGIMTISTAFSVVLFRRITLKDQFIMGDMLDQSGGDVSRLLKYMLRYTLVIEAFGAIILSLRFIPYFGNAEKGLYYAIFHSISAFCNAGFSLFADSFCRFRGDFLINSAIMGLIMIGGIGFVVIVNLHEIVKYARRGEKVRFTLHTRMVLITSGSLIAAGALYFLAAEWNAAFAGMPLQEKFLAAMFQSVTCRTAGFNTVDTAAFSATSLLFSIVLMFIGASPGSTGGGIKTTTFAVLVLRVKGVLFGRDELEYSGRTIPRIILNKSISIVMLSALICLIFLLVLTWIEGKSFIHLFFETVSAFGTVGLSCGLTGTLTDPGKLLITLLMFIGRIGPLTLALAIGERIIKGTFAFPEERVMVG